MLADLPTACDVGCKKNSKGYKEAWTGYKLHIDVASGQIPVSCVLTSALSPRQPGRHSLDDHDERPRLLSLAFRARVVNYADDFVILSRGRAAEALAC